MNTQTNTNRQQLQRGDSNAAVRRNPTNVMSIATYRRRSLLVSKQLTLFSRGAAGPAPAARIFFAAVLLGALLLGVPAQAVEQIVYVNQNAPASSARNGTSWANAYTDLAQAVVNANPTA